MVWGATKEVGFGAFVASKISTILSTTHCATAKRRAVKIYAIEEKQSTRASSPDLLQWTVSVLQRKQFSDTRAGHIRC